VSPRSLEQLLEDLSAHDIALTIRDGQLEVEGPVAELHDDLVEELRARKGELIEALWPESPVLKPQKPDGGSDAAGVAPRPKRERKASPAPEADGPQPVVIGSFSVDPTPASRARRPAPVPVGTAAPAAATAPSRGGFLSRLLGDDPEL
jgi:hypothetical protein